MGAPPAMILSYATQTPFLDSYGERAYNHPFVTAANE